MPTFVTQQRVDCHLMLRLFAGFRQQLPPLVAVGYNKKSVRRSNSLDVFLLVRKFTAARKCDHCLS